MALDDLLKGLAVFQQGMQQYQTAQAVNDANEQMLALNQQQLDKQQQLQAQTQISQGLAMRLGAAGADASKIQALTSEIAPSQGAQYQADVSKDMQADSQGFQSDEKQKDRDLQLRLKQMELDAMKNKAGQKLSKEQIALITKEQGAFDSQAKKPLEALNQLQIAKAALSSNNPIGDASVVNFMVKASGDTGVITEPDKKVFGGSRAYAAQAKQFAENAKSGKFTAENRKFMQDLINVYEKKQTENVLSVRDRLAKRTALKAKMAGHETDEAQIAEMLFPTPQQQLDQKQQEKQKNQAQIAAAQAWLNTPEAKQNPAKAQAVMKRIQQLQGQ